MKSGVSAEEKKTESDGAGGEMNAHLPPEGRAKERFGIRHGRRLFFLLAHDSNGWRHQNNGEQHERYNPPE